MFEIFNFVLLSSVSDYIKFIKYKHPLQNRRQMNGIFARNIAYTTFSGTPYGVNGEGYVYFDCCIRIYAFKSFIVKYALTVFNNFKTNIRGSVNDN